MVTQDSLSRARAQEMLPSSLSSEPIARPRGSPRHLHGLLCISLTEKFQSVQGWSMAVREGTLKFGGGPGREGVVEQ